MEREQFEEKYSNVKLYFKSYYKYSFTFVGNADDGTVITASFGGGANEIYKSSVKSDEPAEVGDLERNWSYVIAEKDGDEIFEWHDPRW